MKNLRLWVMWIAAAAVVAWYGATDPDSGAETIMRLQWLSWLVVAAGPVYLLRRAFCDGARSREAMRRALDSPTGAGLVFLGLALLTGMLFMAFAGRATAAEVPPRAVALLPVLESEAHRVWPDVPWVSVLAAQIEQETCIARTHRSCWNPRAELKTSREYGFGLGQTTVAYRADGSERFNRWREDRAAHPELEAWSWENRHDARLQLRAVALGNRDCYRRLRRLGPDPYNAMAMCDAAHNGGFAAMLGERRLCASADACNANRWFGHVELHSLKSRTPVRGYRHSWYEINRTHVRNVMIVRRPFYALWFGEES